MQTPHVQNFYCEKQRLTDKSFCNENTVYNNTNSERLYNYNRPLVYKKFDTVQKNCVNPTQFDVFVFQKATTVVPPQY